MFQSIPGNRKLLILKERHKFFKYSQRFSDNCCPDIKFLALNWAKERAEVRTVLKNRFIMGWSIRIMGYYGIVLVLVGHRKHWLSMAINGRQWVARQLKWSVTNEQTLTALTVGHKYYKTLTIECNVCIECQSHS